MRARWTLLALVATTGACTYDFNSILFVPRADAGRDLPPPTDLPVTPDAGCRDSKIWLRAAHMAPGFGPVDLCWRRLDGSPYAKAPPDVWPGNGLQYSQVSGYASPGAGGDRSVGWEFAMVEHGMPCTSTVRASLSTLVDPTLRGTLVFLSQPVADGGSLGRLGLLKDEACGECVPVESSVDVRGVHAARGFASTSMDLVFGQVNTVLAANVSYGTTEANGSDGYRCTRREDILVESRFWVQPSGSGAYLMGSELYGLDGVRIERTRRLTIFVHGDPEDTVWAPGFVICYDGVEQDGLTSCDPVAGITPGDAGQDTGPPLDPDAAADAGDDLGAYDAGADDAGAPADAVDEVPDDLGDPVDAGGQGEPDAAVAPLLVGSGDGGRGPGGRN